MTILIINFVFLSISVNFFAGFIVSSLTYYILNRIWPVPATSTRWREVGDEITDLSLVYTDQDGEQEADGDGYYRKSDVESGSGSVQNYIVDEREKKEDYE